MAYEPTSWSKGDVVTSDKLNKIERGIANAGGVMRVMSTENEAGTEAVLDKTWQEICDVFANGGYAYVCDIYEEDGTDEIECAVGIIAYVISSLVDGIYKYYVYVYFNGTELRNYEILSADGYPVHVYEP